MLTIALYVILSTIGWLALARLNYFGYRFLFGAQYTGPDRDLIVLLGPVGTVMLALCGALMGYTKLCCHFGNKLFEASNLKLIAMVLLIPWIGAGIANHVWYARWVGRDYAGQDRDLIMAFGPIGSLLLSLCFAVERTLKLATH